MICGTYTSKINRLFYDVNNNDTIKKKIKYYFSLPKTVALNTSPRFAYEKERKSKKYILFVSKVAFFTIVFLSLV